MKLQHTTAACMMVIQFLWLNGNPGRNLLEFTLIILWVARPTVSQNTLIYFCIKKNNPFLLIRGLHILFLFQCKELGLKKANSYKRLRLVLKTAYACCGHLVELHTTFLLYSFKYVVSITVCFTCHLVVFQEKEKL